MEMCTRAFHFLFRIRCIACLDVVFCLAVVVMPLILNVVVWMCGNSVARRKRESNVSGASEVGESDKDEHKKKKPTHNTCIERNCC